MPVSTAAGTCRATAGVVARVRQPPNHTSSAMVAPAGVVAAAVQLLVLVLMVAGGWLSGSSTSHGAHSSVVVWVVVVATAVSAATTTTVCTLSLLAAKRAVTARCAARCAAHCQHTDSDNRSAAAAANKQQGADHTCAQSPVQAPSTPPTAHVRAACCHQTPRHQCCDVWVLAGQSNCVGTNQADGQAMPRLAAPWPGRILAVDSSQRCWNDATPNVHLGVWGYQDADSCGPDMAFARTLICAGVARQVGLVPAACGGTNLFDQWQPGGALWCRMVADTQAALAALGQRARLRGVLWVQGESDALTPGAAAHYGANFTAWLAATRAALAAHHPCLPVLLVVMAVRGRQRAFPAIDVVAAQQRRLRLPGLRHCEMSGHELYEDPPGSGDLVHLTKAGCCALGCALAWQWAAAEADAEAELHPAVCREQRAPASPPHVKEQASGSCCSPVA